MMRTANVGSILVLSVGLLMAGCNSESDSSEKQIFEPPREGKITVIEGVNSIEEKQNSTFRTYDIRGEATIQFAPQGQEVTQEVKNVQVVVAARNSPYASIQANLMQKRLSKQFIVKCSACHDDYGNGVIGPSLLTMNAQEIRSATVNYSEKPDANVLMTYLVQHMTNEELDFISKDLERFNTEIRLEQRQAESKGKK